MPNIYHLLHFKVAKLIRRKMKSASNQWQTKIQTNKKKNSIEQLQVKEILPSPEW
jgi:hypothetical protein